MSYQSLARKYRPQSFQDMVGQDAVTTALVNGIRLGRAPQAVVFSGVRGVGKTTAARLYAKALNCEVSAQTAHPCNQCESCQAVSEGVHEDVLEIDGASHTGVEDIRSLQETLDYVPQRSPYKVYIIDEVHMLSQSAFNALLKTLEEPPAHVIFVFATTELGKVPETVLSRCQVFHLKHLSVAITVQRIKEILDAECLDYDEHALVTIANEGRGSMRDALTFLDQTIALGEGRVLADVVNGLVNAAPSQTFVTFLQACVQRDPASLLATIESWDQKGISFFKAIEDVARLTRHAMVIKELGRDAIDMALLGLAPGEQEQLDTLAKGASPLDLNRLFRVLVRCRKDLDGSELDRFIVENSMLEWCLDPGLPSLDQLRATLSGQKIVTSEPATQAEKVPTPLKKERKSSQGKLTDIWKSGIKNDRVETQEMAKAPENSVVPEHNVERPKPRSQISMPLPDREESKAKLQSSMPSPGQGHESIPPQLASEAREEKEQKPTLPGTWREVVEAWKRSKPLQGRMLEETIPVSFDSQKIRVAVDPSSMGGSKLLHEDNRKKVCHGLAEMFGFQGQLIVEPQQPGHKTVDEQVQQSLLDERKEAERLQQEKLRQELETHPITVEALNVFDGTIDAVEL